MSALGEMIRTFRGIHGFSLQGVADAAGISKTHIWELERGRNTNPTIETIARVATAAYHHLLHKRQRQLGYKGPEPVADLIHPAVDHQGRGPQQEK